MRCGLGFVVLLGCHQVEGESEERRDQEPNDKEYVLAKLVAELAQLDKQLRPGHCAESTSHPLSALASAYRNF